MSCHTLQSMLKNELVFLLWIRLKKTNFDIKSGGDLTEEFGGCEVKGMTRKIERN